MADLRVITPTGVEAALGESVVEEFASNLRGELLRSGDSDYEEARLVWNDLIDKRPAIIARCAGADDIIDSVNFARENDLLMAVRGGGHNVAGNAVCDGGLVIDLSPMKRIRVDPERRTVRAEGGATWADLDRETQVFGLATPGGEVSETGIAGLTLGGGIGLLRRKYGLSCDNLLSADVVSADGRLLTASETENADLFWGIRGGGGNFGVVTTFEYRLHQVGPEVMSAAVMYPFGQATEVLHDWRDYTEKAPDEATSEVLLWSIPDIPDFPEELRGEPTVVVAGMYAGPAEAGELELQPLREFGTPLVDLSGIQPYTAAQSDFDGFFPEGLLYYWKSLYLDHLDDEVINAMVFHAENRPSPQTPLVIRHLGGAICRVPEEATAYGNRNARFNLSIDATWEDPMQSERNITWTREVWTEMRQFSSGGIYLNFAGFLEEGEKLLHEAHGKNYERLVALKTKYDPTNLFRLNHNIKPTV
ncbi:MAG: FAD-binding oxidoreductase [Rubrobacteraceae bacterium]|nr:FAD-binding oxidoreductase [Rubrobacteraceae bacterium]MBA3615968.1 FAD-binding oxidoreductase [Rubrobacteraceae bacterium]MDQ3496970.1 FAD-binding oxidoreductase [Actinomycetota bacterium]